MQNPSDLPSLNSGSASAAGAAPPSGIATPEMAAVTPADCGRLTDSVATAAANPPPVGGSFGRYELLEEIARGGMGVVYKAHDPRLQRVIALKRIRSGALAQTDEVERFLREARAVAQLNHPHLIKIHDFGEVAGQPYFTMDLAAASLAAELGRVAADPKAAVAVLEKVARAVQCAHAKGIVHRDLKPANILLDEHGEPLVSDFGLARLLEPETELTYTGMTPGTPAYMAPEQARGQRASPASDLWALGVMLYELLTGQRPFAGGSREEIISRVLAAEPPAPRALKPKVDRDLETVVLKCLEKEPRDRYPSAEALADDLARWQRGEPVMARRRPWPVRLGRWTRRHYLLSTGAAVAGLAAGGIPLALHLLDPERPLHALQARLADGETVTLIGPTGPPRWHRWRLGASAFVNAANEPLRIHSGALSLLELLPGLPGERYRFRAEVRQEVGSIGAVGLYFGHHLPAVPQGELHCFGAATFGDRGQRLRRDAAGRQSGFVALDFRIAWRPGQTVYGTASLGTRGDCPPGPPAGEGTWHALTVEVTPRDVRLIWDDQRPFAPVTRARLSDRARLLALGRRDLVGVVPAFVARGPLGLYVENSLASFRNVTVVPLPAQQG